MVAIYPAAYRTEALRGDIVRVGPNALSFATPKSYMVIYGHPKQGQKKFIKAAVYDKGQRRIANVRDPAEHAQQRKPPPPNAFSARALRDQEAVIHCYFDLLVGSSISSATVATSL